MQKVLLLSQENDARSFLSIVRSLGRKNIIVHTTWHNNSTYSLHSKYISKKIALPVFNKKNTDWLDALNKLINEENYSLIIPCDDLSIIQLEYYKDKISDNGKLYLLNSSTYQVVNNKHNTTELAVSLGINTPKSHLYTQKCSPEDITSEFSLPVVLKPVSSFDIESTSRHQVKIVNNISRLKDELNQLLKESPIQVQSYFHGIGMAISLLANNGQICIASQHKRLHEPFTGGGSSYRVSMPINKELYNACEKLVKKLDYTGVAMVEYRYNLTTNEWVLLEINGRFWGSLPLAISAGIDYPYLLFLTLTNQELLLSNIKYKVSTRQRNIEEDIYWLNDALFNVSKKELNTQGYSKIKVLLELSRLVFFRDKIDTFALDDLRPFWAELTAITGSIVYAIKKKTRRVFLKNTLIRSILREKLLKKLRKSNNVLFVCKGNICRSPFAHQVAKSLWDNIQKIDSTGYYGETNRKAPDIAIATAQKYPIELSEHRSSSINEDSVSSADVILYFDEENRKSLYEKYSKYKNKMYPISLLADSNLIEIEDPIDKNENEFAETYTQIYNLILNTSILIK